MLEKSMDCSKTRKSAQGTRRSNSNTHDTQLMRFAAARTPMRAATARNGRVCRAQSTRSSSSRAWRRTTTTRGAAPRQQGIARGRSTDADLDDLLAFEPPPPPRKAKRKAKRAPEDAPKPSAREGRQHCCYGCGAGLQTKQPQAAGFVAPETFSTKAKHGHLGQVLCTRCRMLCNGKLVPGIADPALASSPDGLGLEGGPREALLTPADLRRQLLALRNRKQLVLHVVDLTDVQGTFLRQIRDVAAGNPIAIIATKFDLLPRPPPSPQEEAYSWRTPQGPVRRRPPQPHAGAVLSWLLDYLASTGVKPISTILVSSKTGFGIGRAAKLVQTQRRGRDVLVLGAANAGKSAFVTRLLGAMGDPAGRGGAGVDPAAAAALRHAPVAAAMPGTTLGVIALKAFQGGGRLLDTPGLHLDHRCESSRMRACARACVCDRISLSLSHTHTHTHTHNLSDASPFLSLRFGC